MSTAFKRRMLSKFHMPYLHMDTHEHTREAIKKIHAEKFQPNKSILTRGYSYVHGCIHVWGIRYKGLADTSSANHGIQDRNQVVSMQCSVIKHSHSLRIATSKLSRHALPSYITSGNTYPSITALAKQWYQSIVASTFSIHMLKIGTPPAALPVSSLSSSHMQGENSPSDVAMNSPGRKTLTMITKVVNTWHEATRYCAKKQMNVRIQP